MDIIRCKDGGLAELVLELLGLPSKDSSCWRYMGGSPTSTVVKKKNVIGSNGIVGAGVLLFWRAWICSCANKSSNRKSITAVFW